MEEDEEVRERVEEEEDERGIEREGGGWEERRERGRDEEKGEESGYRLLQGNGPSYGFILFISLHFSCPAPNTSLTLTHTHPHRHITSLTLTRHPPHWHPPLHSRPRPSPSHLIYGEGVFYLGEMEDICFLQTVPENILGESVSPLVKR